MTIGRAGVGGGLAAEKLEVLWGSRGNPRDWALRRGELEDVQKIIADTKKSLDDLSKAMAQVKDDIDELNVAVAALEGEMDAIEGRIDDAEDSLAALEGSIADIEGSIGSINASIATLQTDVSHLQIDVTALQGSVSSVTVDVAYLQASVTTLQGDVTALQGDVSTLDSQVAILQTDVDGLEADVTTLQGDVVALQADAMSRYALQSNPGANPFDPGIEAIPLYTNGELTGGITLTGNQTFTVPVSGLYMYEVEVRIDGGATGMPPLGTAFALSMDTITVPTSPRQGYSVSDVVRAMTITRLVCVERLAPGAQRVAYFLNQGAAAYQVTSAVVKITRISA